MGMGLGVIFGVVRLFLKPASGVLEFTSKTLYGASDAIKAWGDEVVRVPRTRVRSPRHFGMFLADAAGGPCFGLCDPLQHTCPAVASASRGTLASRPAQQARPFPACTVRMARLLMHRPVERQPCPLRDAAGEPLAASRSDSTVCFIVLQQLGSTAVQQSCLQTEATWSTKAAGSSLTPHAHMALPLPPPQRRQGPRTALSPDFLLLRRLLDSSHSCPCSSFPPPSPPITKAETTLRPEATP